MYTLIVQHVQKPQLRQNSTKDIEFEWVDEGSKTMHSDDTTVTSMWYTEIFVHQNW